MPTDPWPATVRRAKQLEAMGFHHLWVYDHFTWRRYRDRPWHSTYPWLAGLASETSRIRLGTMVANPNIRHPLGLAKNAMTIDHISEGRLTIGLGTGGTGFDATVLGQEPLTPGQRVDRLEEFVLLLDRLLRGEITNHSGDWYQIHEGRVQPGCVQQPRVPIAIGAGSPRTLRLTADLGDAWITYGDTSGKELSEAGTEEIVARQLAHIEERCAATGRDPLTIRRIYLIGNTQAKPLTSVDSFVEFAGRYRQLGFTDLVFHHPRPDDPIWDEPEEVVERIAEAVLQTD